MDRVILGFSNVTRFYTGGQVGRTNYTVMKTCNLDSLDANLVKVNGTKQPIIYAGIDNIICDEIHNTNQDDQIQDLGKDAIDKVFDMLRKFKAENKTTPIVIVQPLQRPIQNKYDENLDNWTAYIGKDGGMI